MTGGDKGGQIDGVLDSVEQAAGPRTISLGDVIEELGPRAFAPLMLIVALVMISPVAGIPGASAVAALIIGTILIQMVLGRDRLWLPDWLKRRQMKARSMEKAVTFLRKPARLIDPLIRPRLEGLTRMPGSLPAVILCFLLLAGMPFMDFIPTLSTVASAALALFAIGFLSHDGAFMILGFAWVAIMIGASLLVLV